MTGAADDDPSGVTTYAVAGAAFGTGMLWTAVVTLPLMAAIQLVCAHIGVVSGRGLAGAMRAHYPRWFLYAACVLLLVANVFNIAADLAGMADAAETLTGVTSGLWVPVFGLLVLAATIYTSYATFALWLKWLTAVLFAYVISAFLAHPNWANALRDTLVPRLSLDAAFVSTLVGILGTTISPYLFFWQASQEVEEERALGRRTVRERHGATDHELRDVRRDVVTGMVFSNVVMYFIMLSAAATLHRAGRDCATSRPAVRRPRRCGRWPATRPICSSRLASSAPASWPFPSSPARRRTPWPKSSAGGPGSIFRPGALAASMPCSAVRSWPARCWTR